VEARFRHLLCPIDFSETSRHAFDHAVMLARWYGARVSILHVHQLSIPVYGVSHLGQEAVQPVLLTDAERQHLMDRLNSEVAADRASAGLEIDVALLEAIGVADTILEQARELAVDGLVLGTHGRSGIQRLILGSVAERVLRQAACPVLTVPPRTPDAVPRDVKALERILCPIDFSPSSIRALDYAGSLAREAGAIVTVLHVVELPPDLSDFPSSGVAEYRNSQFQKALAAVTRAIGDTLDPTCVAEPLVLVGKSYREILRVAADQEADLIAMGVRGRGSLDLLFFGSTANHVVREARCPVLTIRGR
jgi:nucleotide-binding universal stress UspA family protein